MQMERARKAAEVRAEAASDVGLCPAGCGAGMRRVFCLKGNVVARCQSCGLYMSPMTLPTCGEPTLDRAEIEAGLRSVRVANYAHVLRRLRERTSLTGRKLLDVGCGSGWFLELAARAGCECYGIEPDDFFYRRTASGPASGARLVQGFFPRDLPPRWGPFDIISFNDVFEHIGEAGPILRAARHRLATGGHLVFSLPVADGFVFRLAQCLHQLGITAPIERMFQVHYPYPHLYYFTRRSFVTLARHEGLEPALVERLRSFSIRGAVHRAKMDRSPGAAGWLGRYAAAGALLILASAERLVPADNVMVILRPRTT